MFSGTQVHEFFHDARHLLGFPATEEAEMIGKLLFKGMIAGILAGLVAFAFAHHFGEPQVDRAIGIEESLPLMLTNTAASADGSEEEVFSRQTQSGVGLMAGMALFGAALGGGLALAWAFSYQRFGPSDPRVLALVPGAGRLSGNEPDARSEIPAQSARSRQPGDHRLSYRAVLRHDVAFHRHRHRGRVVITSANTAPREGMR
jgi:hypothetical protein